MAARPAALSQGAQVQAGRSQELHGLEAISCRAAGTLRQVLQVYTEAVHRPAALGQGQQPHIPGPLLISPGRKDERHTRHQRGQSQISTCGLPEDGGGYSDAMDADDRKRLNSELRDSAQALQHKLTETVIDNGNNIIQRFNHREQQVSQTRRYQGLPRRTPIGCSKRKMVLRPLPFRSFGKGV